MRNVTRCRRTQDQEAIPWPSVPIAEATDRMRSAVRSLIDIDGMGDDPELFDTAIMLCTVTWLAYPSGALEATDRALIAACAALRPEVEPVAAELIAGELVP